MSKIYECLIIGAGPSGIGAAIKLHQAGVEVAIIEMSTPGGKINIAPRVDNYPGQHEIAGPDLAVIFFERLMKEGVEFIGDEITSLTKDGDTFVPMGSTEIEKPDSDEVVYAVGSEVRTRRWAWRQSDYGKITPDTSYVFFPIDGFKGINEKEVELAAQELVKNLKEIFNCEVVSGHVEADAPEFEWNL